MANQVYVFRAKLKGWHGVRRTIAIRAEETLVDLHDALQAAFAWDGQRPFAFWLSGRFWAREGVEYVHPLGLKGKSLQGSHSAIAGLRRRSAARPLERLGLIDGQRIAYVFDFHREWRVRLTLRRALGGAICSTEAGSSSTAPRSQRSSDRHAAHDPR